MGSHDQGRVDRDVAFGFQAIQQRLDRIENHLLALTERKEGRGEQYTLLLRISTLIISHFTSLRRIHQ